MPILDMIVVGLLISFIGGILISKCYYKKILGKVCIAFFTSLFIASMVLGWRGMSLNYQCIDSNRNIVSDKGNDKMPIPFELAYVFSRTK